MGRFRYKGVISIAGYLVSTIAIAQTASPPNGAGPQELGPELYRQVLDTAFPPPPKIEADVVLTMSIRYDEAFGGTAQVNMTLYRGKDPEVEYFVTGVDVTHVFDEAKNARGDTSPTSLAGRMMVSRKHVKVSVPKIFEWQQGLFKSWAATLPNFSDRTGKVYEGRPATIMVDANTYEISYAQVETKMHGVFVGSKSEPVITKWAEEVRSEIIKRVQ